MTYAFYVLFVTSLLILQERRVKINGPTIITKRHCPWELRFLYFPKLVFLAGCGKANVSLEEESKPSTRISNCVCVCVCVWIFPLGDVFSVRLCDYEMKMKINHFSSTNPAWGNYRLQKQVIMAQINSSALPRLRHQHCFGAVLAILAYIYSLHPPHRREPLHSTVSYNTPQMLFLLCLFSFMH